MGLVRASGVDEAAIRRLADSYIKSGRVIIAWCLGVTQHEHGVDTVREISAIDSSGAPGMRMIPAAISAAATLAAPAECALPSSCSRPATPSTTG